MLTMKGIRFECTHLCWMNLQMNSPVYSSSAQDTCYYQHFLCQAALYCSGHCAPKKSPCTDFCHCRFALLIFKLNVSGFVQSVFIVHWMLWLLPEFICLLIWNSVSLHAELVVFVFFLFLLRGSLPPYAYLWNCFGVYPRRHPTPCTLLLTVWKECGPPEDTRPCRMQVLVSGGSWCFTR